MRYDRFLEAHCEAAWGPVRERRALGAGPIHELPSGFEILFFRSAKGMWVLSTRCMSTPEDEPRLELHMRIKPKHLADGAAHLVEILTAAAHYHRTGSPLGLGHTVNFGKPWLLGSACTRGLVSLPYLDGPTLEQSIEPKVRFLWLIPITPSELAFAKMHGIDALERRFETTRFDYADPLRKPVVAALN